MRAAFNKLAHSKRASRFAETKAVAVLAQSNFFK